MRADLYSPLEEGEGRLLLLIDEFSKGERCLEGRTKLAKLDFLLRYPKFLRKALNIRTAGKQVLEATSDVADIESRMVRYRYGPWDPSYFVLLGRLIGKGLVVPIPYRYGIGYKSTVKGHEISSELKKSESWEPVGKRATLLRRHFNLSGNSLKKFIYANFPEVAGADWGEQL